jgi:RES domain-containing protein
LRRVFRLTRRPYAANPFDGQGAFLFGERWSRPGTRLVYTAEHLSLAMLEYLAHLDPNNVPEDLVLASAEIPEGLSTVRVRDSDLPPHWRHFPAPPELSNIGDRFVQEGKSAVLVVPSALAREESNWLLNPKHPDFGKIKILPRVDFSFDTRLLQ